MNFPTFLFVYLRFNSKVPGKSWKYFYFIKNIREGFFQLCKDTEEEKASITLALFLRHAQLAVMRNLRSEALGRAST